MPGPGHQLRGVLEPDRTWWGLSSMEMLGIPSRNSGNTSSVLRWKLLPAPGLSLEEGIGETRLSQERQFQHLWLKCL